jgi:hypothetical protein
MRGQRVKCFERAVTGAGESYCPPPERGPSGRLNLQTTEAKDLPVGAGTVKRPEGPRSCPVATGAATDAPDGCSAAGNYFLTVVQLFNFTQSESGSGEALFQSEAGASILTFSM